MDVYLNDSNIDTNNDDKNKSDKIDKNKKDYGYDNENNDYLEQQSKLPFTLLFKWTKPFINAFQII